MQIKFADGSIGISLSDSPLRNHLEKIYKHLQHVNIPPDATSRLTKSDLKSKIDYLDHTAGVLGIAIDKTRCYDLDQQYFNTLHVIFEKNHDGSQAWTEFHDAIHTCESGISTDVLRLGYRDLAGPFVTKMHRDWIKHGVTKLKAGQVFCRWEELGKTPYRYWYDGEPDNLDRILELVKPWINFRPDLHIALSDIDYTASRDMEKFLQWWQRYQTAWCEHWGLDDWHPLEQFRVIPVGNVEDLSALRQYCDQGIRPERVCLDAQPDTEIVRFVIEIDARYATHCPYVEVSIDDIAMHRLELLSGSNIIEFEHKLTPGNHTLQIYRGGATDCDPTQIVEIQQVYVDNLDLKPMILKASHYRPIYPAVWAEQQRHKGVDLLELVPYETVLGHDGFWSLEFSSPFYPSYLETLKVPFQ